MTHDHDLQSPTFAAVLRPGRAAAGCWTLDAGRAMTLRPREPGTLEIARGRVWVTLGGGAGLLPDAGGDHVLAPTERLATAPGQHVVVEAWGPSGAAEAAAFRWDPVPARARSAAAREWDCGVVQPLRDLGHALGQGARALGAAFGDALAAGGRLAVGLARFALHRTAQPFQRKPA